jgi:hypothetical protein
MTIAPETIPGTIKTGSKIAARIQEAINRMANYSRDAA